MRPVVMVPLATMPNTVVALTRILDLPLVPGRTSLLDAVCTPLLNAFWASARSPVAERNECQWLGSSVTLSKAGFPLLWYSSLWKASKLEFGICIVAELKSTLMSILILVNGMVMSALSAPFLMAALRATGMGGLLSVGPNQK